MTSQPNTKGTMMRDLTLSDATLRQPGPPPRCAWCGQIYNSETRRPMLPGPDGERHPSPYCSMDCEEEGHSATD